MQGDTLQGGEADRVTQLQQIPRGTSSCVCLRALALFQRLAEAAGAALGQDSPAPGSTPRLCQQTPPAAEGNLQDAEDAATNCSSSLRMSYPKNSPGMAPWCSQELAEGPWCPLHLQHKAQLRGNKDMQEGQHPV